VPESTLRSRLRGVQHRAISRANSHKLTEVEEETLQKWILSLDDRGAAPRPTTVRETANLLLQARGTTPVQTVGENWVYNFVKRHPELSTRFSRRYNYERAKYEDPKIIGEWFNLVQTILQFGITPDDVYNFDETGFAIGLIATAKVVMRAQYYGRRSLLQPGNREWVTPIECINASGWAYTSLDQEGTGRFMTTIKNSAVPAESLMPWLRRTGLLITQYYRCLLHARD
jgi:hypothetical protein